MEPAPLAARLQPEALVLEHLPPVRIGADVERLFLDATARAEPVGPPIDSFQPQFWHRRRVDGFENDDRAPSHTHSLAKDGPRVVCMV